MQIYQVTDERFKKYGKVISNVDFTELVKALEEKTPLPEGVNMFRAVRHWKRFP